MFEARRLAFDVGCFSFVLLVLVSGWHVISVSNWTWTAQGEDIDALYKRSIGFSTCTWPLPVAEKIRGVPTQTGSC